MNIEKLYEILLSDKPSKLILEIRNIFNDEELEKLYELRTADVLAQNPKYYYVLNDYEKEKKKILNRGEKHDL